ncbi:S13-like H2TH domain-containing protein [Cylindrobasidium torrendii FP15055 ss-10]|uniref:S13-like H2TH domain-containing protein n=1 Tax=Cylindrobasidium torrendii FP15055 ss-10 TaxID=1314674 RepID=A0A0D7BNF1_9AGAR|nr:S13-like H2TH domain-containing protein [Cylindrobasidium torrendii FP15055 ss-10]
MVHILGIKLTDSQRAKWALTNIYGVGHHVAARLCARFQIHDQMKVGDLTPIQVSSLASFLSSPGTAPPLPRYPLAGPDFKPPPMRTPAQQLQAEFREQQAAKKAKLVAQGAAKQPAKDPLNALRIENDLRRMIRENIQHHRMIGTWRGKRWGMSLPVRGQQTKTNAVTAKKLNHPNRYNS